MIYGTNRAITDRKFPLDEITEALKGNVVTDLKDLDEDENEFERKLNVPLYEIYAPLRDSRTGDIIAVGEFYEKADSLKREISRVRQQVWADVGTATLAMLTLLFFIVRRSDKIIQQQQVALRLRLQEQTRLHISNAEFQHKMATATQEFSRVNELTLRRIGADLHDGPAQLLTLILIRLDDLAENCSAVDQESLETIRGAATDALNEVRSADTFQLIPARAGIQCQKGVIFGFRNRQHQHLHIRHFRGNESHRGENIPRHIDVHQHHVRALPLGNIPGILRIGALLHDLKIRSFSQCIGNALTQHRMIVDNADANGWTHDPLPKGLALEHSLINSREPGKPPVISCMSRAPDVRISDSGRMQSEPEQETILKKYISLLIHLIVF